MGVLLAIIVVLIGLWACGTRFEPDNERRIWVAFIALACFVAFTIIATIPH
jgi:hypothetical protein